MKVARGECDAGRFQLEFIATDLQNEEVPQQLQVVGQLCQDQGKAVVNCMGSTIMYTVNPYCKTDVYHLKVLTVVTEISSCPALPQNMMCAVGNGETSKKGI